MQLLRGSYRERASGNGKSVAPDSIGEPRQKNLVKEIQTTICLQPSSYRKRGIREAWSLKTMLCKIQVRFHLMSCMQLKGDKLHKKAEEKRGCIFVSQLHKQMYPEQKIAAQMYASFHLKLHKVETDASEQEQSFR